METSQYKVTYEINNQTYTDEFTVTGELDHPDLKLAARKTIRTKHPGVKYWEIRTVSLEKIT